MADKGSMERIMVFDRLDSFLFDLDPDQVRNIPYVDEINGEHSITISTSQSLAKTNRLLIRDGMGTWFEYVVLGVIETHEQRSGTEAEYYCIWSLQYDLMCTFINGPYDCGIVPGHASVPQLPRTALEVALGGTSRWVVGNITVTTMAAASFYRRSGWEGLQTVVEKWGGELQATITVDSHGVVSRSVDLLTHVGSSTATRRFDFGYDIASIKRTVSDDIWPCRIVPLGKAQETENGGYTRRPSIESVNGGVMWLQNDAVVPYTRIPDGNGGYEYPTLIVENDTFEEPSDLKAWALEHIGDYTQPRVSYEAEVVQFVKAGLNPHGVALGDDVAIVDWTFGEEGLGITARVTKISGNLLDSTDMTLTIGNMADSFGKQLDGISRQVSSLESVVSRSQEFQATVEYVSHLVSRINQEVNATGGYTYITEGYGIRTYDRVVSDPLVGAEATSVTEIKGGTVRIANSRTSGGDWDWKTVFLSGHIAAELVTAARIIAGYIGTAGDTYIDLDNHTVQLGQTSGPHVTVNTGGIDLFDANGSSVLFAGLSGGSSIVRCGKATGAGNVVMSSEGYVRVRTGSDIIAHFGTAEYTQDSQVVRGPYYNLGTREGEPGANTIVGGVDNFAGIQCRYASTFGRGLMAPGNLSGGVAIGKYNVAGGSGQDRYAGKSLGIGQPVFVIGNGTDANHRSNALEVDGLGNLCIAGKIKSSKMLIPVTSSVSSATPAEGSGNYAELTNIQLTDSGTWLVIINLRFSGLTTSSASTEARGSASTSSADGGTIVCKTTTSKTALSSVGVYTNGTIGQRLYLNAGCSNGYNPTVSGSITAIQIA